MTCVCGYGMTCVCVCVCVCRYGMTHVCRYGVRYVVDTKSSHTTIFILYDYLNGV